MTAYDGTGEPCRFCGDRSWITDEKGHIHRCCRDAEKAGDRRCVPCVEAKKLRAKALRGGRRRAVLT